MSLSKELLEYGCSCHLSPPCSFCTSMDAGESNAYANGGMQELKEYIHQQESRVERIMQALFGTEEGSQAAQEIENYYCENILKPALERKDSE